MAGVPNFFTGSKTNINTTASAITTINTNAQRGVQVLADPANAVSVFVGPAGVTAGTSNPTTDGYPLAAGDSIVIPVIEPSKIHAITASSSGIIHFMLV